LLAQHRRLRDAAEERGHDGEECWHEAEIDALIEARRTLAP